MFKVVIQVNAAFTSTEAFSLFQGAPKLFKMRRACSTLKKICCPGIPGKILKCLFSIAAFFSVTAAHFTNLDKYKRIWLFGKLKIYIFGDHYPANVPEPSPRSDFQLVIQPEYLRTRITLIVTNI